MILLGGRAGPFYYGDYKVYDRVEQGRLNGCFGRCMRPRTPGAAAISDGEVISHRGSGPQTELHVRRRAGIVSPQVQRYFEAVDLHNFKFVVSEDLRGGTAEELLARGQLPAG